MSPLVLSLLCLLSLFFFNDTATTEIYTLSLHDALPISFGPGVHPAPFILRLRHSRHRSEEHTSELQSHLNLVCRLLLEKTKKHTYTEEGQGRWDGCVWRRLFTSLW